MSPRWFYAKTMREIPGGGDGQCYAVIPATPYFVPMLDLKPDGKVMLDLDPDAWRDELPQGACAYDVTLVERTA